MENGNTKLRPAYQTTGVKKHLKQDILVVPSCPKFHELRKSRNVIGLMLSLTYHQSRQVKQVKITPHQNIHELPKL